MPAIAVWSVSDFGAANLFDIINGTFSISAGATADIAEFSDDDADFDDFFANGGQTQDPGLNQTLTQDFQLDGVTIASTGDQIYNAAEGVIVNDTTGETGRILYITINGGSVGDFIGVATTIEINPGDSVTTSALAPQATEAYTEIVACFTAGCQIKTETGNVPVEQLQVGDKVWTQGDRFLPIEWIGKKSLTKAMLQDKPNLSPVKIQKDALGPNLPSQDMSVSRQHRILITSHVAEMLFGASEVLVPAVGLTNLPGINEELDVDGVEYWHILLADHQIIKCNNLDTESFLPSVDGAFSQAQAELIALFPDLIANPMIFGPTAKPSLTVSETRILTSIMLEVDQFAFASQPSSVSPMHVL
ncbi:MAG: Hint domain-containing protein [Paracoccaceae bacterium]